ncbi:1-aminocyclopropane-1-carboxylate deaminase/D-cysteine desulfhydrase [Winogradskyella sp. A3E31]|uniref:1-aminocyclopropane-1-carboxylate deaminase/D-cysteine desulfhydrase n=1 Tax=Winogradskyella sp. A3E31 TaxID=3349637 RepID=UPI00398B3699
MDDLITSRIQEIHHNLKTDVRLFIKREDEIHPIVSGNKYRKLKYNLIEVKKSGLDTILTFGGAYSNHIAAVALACKKQRITSIGVIRGEELKAKIGSNPTLKFAEECGMQFYFVSREDYRKKTEPDFIQKLENKFGSFYLLPEGGTNELAVKGCEEILNKEDEDFDFICCSVGTGGTVSGLVNASNYHQNVLGFSALKGNFLIQDIRKFANKNNWDLVTDYHFGGYAKIKDELIAFINQFKDQYNILLDPIYTGKMAYGIFDLMNKDYFPSGSKILMIHTGGLQGIEGMNKKLSSKNKPQIKI